MRSTDTLQQSTPAVFFSPALASLASAIQAEMQAEGVSQYRLGEVFAQEIAREIRAGGFDCTALPEGDGTWRIYAENAEPWEQETFDIVGDR
jgi:hypothetical protein